MRKRSGANERVTMPSDQTSPPCHPSKAGKKTCPTRPLKSKSPDLEGSFGQAERMTASLDSSRRSHHLPSEVEKDSGFSDVSSECLSTVEQTDTEDQLARSLRHSARLQRAPQKAPGGLPGSTFAGLTPLYIVKNVSLKQPLGLSPSAAQFLAWSNRHPLDSLQGSPARVLFLQQPLATLQPLLPGQKPAPKETGLPSLSSYPKIAPHPGRDRQAKAGPEPVLTGSIGKNKRFCLEEARVSSSEPTAAKCGEEEPGAEPPLPPSSDQLPPAVVGPRAVSQNGVTSSTGSKLPGLDQAEVRMISRASKKLGFSSLGKQRRFQNTVEILRRSGLLGITLRTKELIRQSSNTQRDLAELREHAQLLYEAVQSKDSHAWTRLQEAMSRSNAYWTSKGAAAYSLPGQSSGAGATDSSGVVTRESPPCSPMNLSLVPDTSVSGALP